MKYKAGDKVVMKKRSGYNLNVVEYFEDHPDMILTIKEVRENGEIYIMEEFSYHWCDKDIVKLAKERLAIEPHLTRPVVTRFDLMDFED